MAYSRVDVTNHALLLPSSYSTTNLNLEDVESIYENDSNQTYHAPDDIEPPASGETNVCLYHALYVAPVVITLITMGWPWVLFGVVRNLHGVAANLHIVAFMDANPTIITFLVTLSSTLFTAILALLFSTAIVRFSQKWIVRRQEVDVFHISFFMTLRYQFFPWSAKELSMLTGRRYLVTIVVACIFTFNLIPPSISALLTPTRFNRTEIFSGTELDIASNSPNCIAWIASNIQADELNVDENNLFRGFQYSTESDTLDLLEGGRDGIPSNGKQTRIFRQLSGRDGLHFVGPVRGVLPIGLYGSPALENLNQSDAGGMDAPLFNQYTLELQGLVSQIKCSYDEENSVFRNITSCPANEDVVALGGPVPSLDRTLTHWLYLLVCGQGNRNRRAAAFQSYHLYVAGGPAYNDAIGNITCTLTPQPAIFPVIYSPQSGIITVEQPIEMLTNFSKFIIEEPIHRLSDLMEEVQTDNVNLIAQAIIASGVKLGLQANQKSETYLEIVEAILGAIIDYEATHFRLLSTANFTSAPQSCRRNVTATLIYEVPGWFYSNEMIGLLFPVTVIGLATLILLLSAELIGEKVIYETDPTNPESLLLAQKEVVQEGKNLRIELLSASPTTTSFAGSSKDTTKKKVPTSFEAVALVDYWESGLWGIGLLDEQFRYFYEKLGASSSHSDLNS